MKIKKYVADDFQSAFKQAKKEMGRDAIILSSRQIKTGGFLGFFARMKVEITVAVDDDMRVERDKLHSVPSESSPVASPSINNYVAPPAPALGEQELQLLQEMHKIN